jgi:hypothetical protein
MPFCAPLSAAGEASHKLSGIPKSSVSRAKLHYDFRVTLRSSVTSALILFIAFRCGDSLSTTARQISDVPVAIFKIFHPAHTAGTHAGNSVNMIVDQRCWQQNCSPLQGVQTTHWKKIRH